MKNINYLEYVSTLPCVCGKPSSCLKRAFPYIHNDLFAFPVCDKCAADSSLMVNQFRYAAETMARAFEDGVLSL